MPARHRLVRHPAAVMATLLVVLAVMPAVAAARPAGDGRGPLAGKSQTPAQLAESSAPAPTVVRTVVKEDAVRALPLALAGLALVVAIGGAAYTLKRTAPLRHQH